MSALGTAAAEAGFNTAGSIISGLVNYNTTKKLMAYQNQMNIENWKRENQYNSPLAQMARLREAGLNPSLVYSSGAENTGGSINTSSPASMAGNINLSNIGSSAVNAYLNAKMNQAQLEHLQNQNDMLKVQMNKEYQETLSQIFLNKRESAYLPHYKDLANITVQAAMANLAGQGLKNKLYQGQININDRTIIQMGQQLDNLRAQGKAISEGVAQQWARIAIDKMLAQSQKAMNDSNIELNGERKNQLIQDTANAVRKGNLLYLEKLSKDLDYEMQKKYTDWKSDQNFLFYLEAEISDATHGSRW